MSINRDWYLANKIPKPKNIYKYLLFFFLVIFFGVVISLYITRRNKSSQLSNNIINKPTPTKINNKLKVAENNQTDVSNTTTSQTLPEEEWLIPFIPGTVDQVLVEDPKIITYQENPNIDVYVIEFSVLNYFDKAEQLAKNSDECNYAYNNNNDSGVVYLKRDENYYNNILSKFSSDDKGYIYVFKYKKENQGRDSWLITLIPNKIGYGRFEDFNNDFIQCAAGADSPKANSGKYLYFESACGTGFNDGSGLPIGCLVAKEVIDPTLKLN